MLSRVIDAPQRPRRPVGPAPAAGSGPARRGYGLPCWCSSHASCAVPPDALFAVSFMNDWTLEHIAGYEPRSHGGFGPVPDGPGLGIEVAVSGLGAPLFTADAPA